MRKESKLYLRLWARVLQKAIEDLYYKPPKNQESVTMYETRKVDQELYWKRQAQHWCNSKSKGFNSFEDVCLILGLEPSCVRKKLHEEGLL